MLRDKIIRAWKDPEYRLDLSEEEQAGLPENPAGAIELTDDELDMAAGGSWTRSSNSRSNSGPYSSSRSQSGSQSRSQSNSGSWSARPSGSWRQSNSRSYSSSNSNSNSNSRSYSHSYSYSQ
jgi:mersacidin/lichenicidin family type 2 lantibiotic